MPRLGTALLICAVAMTAGVASSSVPDKYRPILDRKPFGDVASGIPAAPAPEGKTPEEVAKQEQEVARQVDLVAINRTPSGAVAVGLVDKSNSKKVSNLYLKVGESAAGFTVVEADFKEETASIEKDGVTINLKLGKGLIPSTNSPAIPAADSSSPSSAPSVADTPSKSEPSAPALRVRGSGLVGRGPMPAQFRGRGLRGREGYLQRKAEERKAAEQQAEQQAENERAKMRAEIENEAKARADEVIRQREHDLNIELISQGKEPISPTELTPEEDASLVEQGVLPQ